MAGDALERLFSLAGVFVGVIEGSWNLGKDVTGLLVQQSLHAVGFQPSACEGHHVTVPAVAKTDDVQETRVVGHWVKRSTLASDKEDDCSDEGDAEPVVKHEICADSSGQANRDLEMAVGKGCQVSQPHGTMARKQHTKIIWKENHADVLGSSIQGPVAPLTDFKAGTVSVQAAAVPLDEQHQARVVGTKLPIQASDMGFVDSAPHQGFMAAAAKGADAVAPSPDVSVLPGPEHRGMTVAGRELLPLGPGTQVCRPDEVHDSGMNGDGQNRVRGDLTEGECVGTSGLNDVMQHSTIASEKYETAAPSRVGSDQHQSALERLAEEGEERPVSHPVSVPSSTASGWTNVGSGHDSVAGSILPRRVSSSACSGLTENGGDGVPAGPLVHTPSGLSSEGNSSS